MKLIIESVAAALLLAAAAHADVVSIEIRRREPFAGGASFGATGPYEKIAGVVRFEVDPAHPGNRAIADLDLAPRNARGWVAFESDFFLLAPKDPGKGNRAILYEVNNRGLKLALRAFNGGPGGNDPSTASDAGDGFLLRRGYAIVWSGWIGELLPGDGRLLLRAPIATESGKPIRGPVRYEVTTNVPAASLPLSRREGIGCHPPTERGEEEGVLTWRMREADPRVPLPRSQWSLERLPVPPGGTLPPVRLRLDGGFKPGAIYELVCEAEGPVVQGLGFAAVRDLVSFLRYDASDRNPLRSAIDRAHAFGISQAGRFLRHFLHLDQNADEAGRRVFDGLFPHVAGAGLGSFNHRFAQPTRFNGQHEEHLYLCDVFPFAYGEDLDPFTGRKDAILRGPNPPKVIHTQNASEYWHRSGSLVHTDAKGEKDAAIPANVRVYAIGGTPHGRTRDPALERGVQNPANPLDPRPILKALLDALDAWVRDGAAPPPSVYPRIGDATLVLPRFPEVIQRPHRLDFSVEPPRVLGDYVVRVPAADADGNDRGTLHLPEVAVPLGTFTGWNLRGREIGAEGELAELMGSSIPFARRRADRGDDPRPSIEERYGNFEEYRRRFAAACEKLVSSRYLLREDADRLVVGRAEVEPLFPRTSAAFAFRDVGEEAGLFPDAAGIMGHGAAWGDADGDGWIDLYVGTFHTTTSKANLFFRNSKGKLRLDDQEALRISARATGVVFADLDNDGDLDLYVGSMPATKDSKLGQREGHALAGCALFRNDGAGRFTDISRDNGACPPAFGGRSAAVLDYDGDGLLDLLVGEDPLPGYNGSPTKSTRLFRNLGKLRFEDASRAAGLPEGVPGLGVAAADVTNDGRPDFFLASSAGGNVLFLNEGGGRFRESPGSRQTFAWPGAGGAGGDNMICGVCFGDVNRDGLLDIVLGPHYSTPWREPVPVRLYLNRGIREGAPAFEDVSEAAGLKPLFMKAPHVEVQDFDNDGWPDIYASLVKFADGKPHPLIFRNLGIRDGLPRFREDALDVNDFPTAEDRAIQRSGEMFEKVIREKKIIYMAPGPSGDFDNDGRLDLFLPNWWAEQRSLLLRNETPGGRWLQVEVRGPAGVNRMGIGARIRVSAGGEVLGLRELAVGFGYASGQPAIAHFGLGRAETCDVEVVLPHGKGTLTRKDVKADQRIVIGP